LTLVHFIDLPSTRSPIRSGRCFSYSGKGNFRGHDLIAVLRMGSTLQRQSIAVVRYGPSLLVHQLPVLLGVTAIDLGSTSRTLIVS
jgi:hypothetical protein